MLSSKNSLILAGQIEDVPSLSHKTHDFTFMRFTLKVSRLSGTFDHINILLDESLTENKLQQGDFVEIEGELRSYNNKSGVGNKLIICAYAKSIKHIDKHYKNELFLGGTICKLPIYRKTPLGREICDLMLAVNRRYGRADYIPVIAWGKNAQYLSKLTVGENIELSGRIQSREYIKASDVEDLIRTAFEVSVSSINLP